MYDTPPASVNPSNEKAFSAAATTRENASAPVLQVKNTTPSQFAVKMALIARDEEIAKKAAQEVAFSASVERMTAAAREERENSLAWAASVVKGWEKTSAITPTALSAGVCVVVDEGYQEVREALDYGFSRFWQQNAPEDLGALVAFVQEDGSFWQGQLESSVLRGAGKYSAPKGCGAVLYMPAVSVVEWRLIAERHGVTETLPPWVLTADDSETSTSDASFWGWVASNPQLPIVLTEGGKKALCAISHGAIAISGFGCHGFLAEGQLLDQLKPFAAKARKFVIAFDQDDKISTRRKVSAAKSKLARALRGAGVRDVVSASWSASQGKGLDDLCTQGGAALMLAALDAATPITQEIQPVVEPATRPADIELNDRYLPALDLPELGGTLAVSSPIGTGKTEILKNLIAQARSLTSDKLRVDLVGYRNALGSQSAKRLGLSHLHDMQGEAHSQTFINNEAGLAYCVDSFCRRHEANMAALLRGEKILLILDEVDAVLKHLLLSDTLRSKRLEVLTALSSLIRAIAAGGGWIVVGEADLSDLTLDTLEDLGGNTAKLVINTYKGTPWTVESVTGTSKLGAPSSAKAPQAAKSRAFELLKKGKRVCFASDSARQCEMLDSIAANAGYRVLRLDGSTSGDAWAHSFIADPDTYLAQSAYDLLIYSPSAESGLSIAGDFFDEQVVLGTHLEHRAIIQLAGRVRRNIPRHFFATDKTSKSSGEGLTEENVLATWTDRATASALTSSIDLARLKLSPESTNAHKLAAKYQARINRAGGALKASLIHALKAAGHTVTETIAPFDQVMATLEADARETIENNKAAAFAEAPLMPSPEKARLVMQSEVATPEARLSARKTIKQEQYPDLPLHDQVFVLRNLIKSNGAALQGHTNLYLMLNPEVAQNLDKLSWDSLSGKGIWLPGVAFKGAIAGFLARSPLPEIIKLTEVSEYAPAVQALKAFATHYAGPAKALLGLTINQDQTAIAILNKMVRRLGLKLYKGRKSGGRGDQSQIWTWDSHKNASAFAECEVRLSDREAVFAALERRSAVIAAAVSSISSKESLQKIDDTEAETLTQRGMRVAGEILQKWREGILACKSALDFNKMTIGLNSGQIDAIFEALEPHFFETVACLT